MKDDTLLIYLHLFYSEICYFFIGVYAICISFVCYAFFFGSFLFSNIANKKKQMDIVLLKAWDYLLKLRKLDELKSRRGKNHSQASW